MTVTWPEDPEVRRAVASWGHLMDEALIADGRGEVAGLDWPEDVVVARALAEWGAVTDRVVDEAARLEVENGPLDPTIAWLGGPAASAVAPPVELVELATGVSRPTRKHKVARPGQPVTTTGWSAREEGDVTELVPSRPVPSRWTHAPRWGQMALVAAAAAAVLLVGHTPSSGNRSQALSVGAGSSLPALPGAGSGAPTGSAVGSPTAPQLGIAPAHSGGSVGGPLSAPGGSAGGTGSGGFGPALPRSGSGATGQGPAVSGSVNSLASIPTSVPPGGTSGGIATGVVVTPNQGTTATTTVSCPVSGPSTGPVSVITTTTLPSGGTSPRPTATHPATPTRLVGASGPTTTTTTVPGSSAATSNPTKKSCTSK
jgi:hypothetical protein